jgi:PII-like signaling protein
MRDRPSTRLQGPAKRLTIIVGESDHYRHHSLTTEIVDRARRARLAGCSVFRGTEGFGATGHLHTTRLLSLSEDLPVAIVIVDTPARIEAFLPQLDDLVNGGLVLLEDVEVVRYVADSARAEAAEN